MSEPGPRVASEARKSSVAPPDWVLHGLLIATVVMWGLAFVAIKFMEQEQGVGYVELTLQRFIVAALGFGLLLAVLGYRAPLPRLRGREEWARLMALAFLGVAGYHLTLNYGEQYTTAGNAAIVIASSPAMTLVLAIHFLGERSGPIRLAGMGLAFAGVLVLVGLAGDGEVGVENRLGMAVLVLAPVTWACYNVIGKPLFIAHDPLAITAYFNLLGLLFILPLATPELVDQTLALEPLGWAALLLLAFGGTLLATVFYNIGLRHMAATRAAGFVYLVPLVATGAGVGLLGEPLSIWMFLGGAMVLGGVGLIDRGKVKSSTQPDDGANDEGSPPDHKR